MRDINDPSVSTLANQVHTHLNPFRPPLSPSITQSSNQATSTPPHTSVHPPCLPFSLQIKSKMVALSGLKEKLLEIHAYLLNILDNKLPVNNQIIYNLQTIFNLLPNLNVQDLLKYVDTDQKGGKKTSGKKCGKRKAGIKGREGRTGGGWKGPEGPGGRSPIRVIYLHIYRISSGWDFE